MALWQQHQRKFQQFVATNGVTVTVRQPAAKTAASSAAERVMGKKAQVEGTGVEQVVLGVWSTDYLRPDSVVPGDVSESISALGNTDKVDAMFRCNLPDALSDPDDKQGRSIFDTAHDVLYQGYRWQVVGTKRTGLPPGGPYILWVALRKVGE